MRLTIICKESKQTIFASSGLELLQMISKLDIGRCTSEGARSPTRMDCELLQMVSEPDIEVCTTRTLGPQRR